MRTIANWPGRAAAASMGQSNRSRQAAAVRAEYQLADLADKGVIDAPVLAQLEFAGEVVLAKHLYVDDVTWPEAIGFLSQRLRSERQ